MEKATVLNGKFTSSEVKELNSATKAKKQKTGSLFQSDFKLVPCVICKK
jgi:hypothetical protein